MIVKEFVTHYNRGRPHSALGPGIPEPPRAEAPGRTGICPPLGTASNRRQLSVGCIKNFDWSRRPRSVYDVFVNDSVLLCILRGTLATALKKGTW